MTCAVRSARAATAPSSPSRTMRPAAACTLSSSPPPRPRASTAVAATAVSAARRGRSSITTDATSSTLLASRPVPPRLALAVASVRARLLPRRRFRSNSPPGMTVPPTGAASSRKPSAKRILGMMPLITHVLMEESKTLGETAGAHAVESHAVTGLDQCFGTPLPTRVLGALMGAAAAFGTLDPTSSTSVSVRAMHRRPHRCAWTRTMARSTPNTWAAQLYRMAQKDDARSHDPLPPAECRLQEERT